MSEEQGGGSGLRNAIIGLITIIVTALTGIVAKNFIGEDDATPPPAATAPVVINLENNNTVKTGGGSGGAAQAPAPKKKDDWTKAEPKW